MRMKIVRAVLLVNLVPLSCRNLARAPRDGVGCVQNMAAQTGVGDLNAQSMQIILDFLSSSSSSDDDDLLLNERRIIPKIQNFLGVIHNFSDKEVISLLYFCGLHFIACKQRSKCLYYRSSLKVIFDFLGKQRTKL